MTEQRGAEPEELIDDLPTEERFRLGLEAFTLVQELADGAARELAEMEVGSAAADEGVLRLGILAYVLAAVGAALRRDGAAAGYEVEPLNRAEAQADLEGAAGLHEVEIAPDGTVTWPSSVPPEVQAEMAGFIQEMVGEARERGGRVRILIGRKSAGPEMQA